jgi:hypothetical protein
VGDRAWKEPAAWCKAPEAAGVRLGRHEDGYYDDPESVAEHVSDLGAAGINIEDSTNGELINPQARRHSTISETSFDYIATDQIA